METVAAVLAIGGLSLMPLIVYHALKAAQS